MTTSTRLALALAPFALLAGQAHAAGTSSTQSGTASATLVAPIVLSHTAGASLNFGKFASGTLGGTVVVTAAGAGSTTSDVTFVPGSTVAADSFTVTGDAGRSIAITATNSSVTAGAQTLNFTTALSGATATLGVTGTATIRVGGTLTVPGNAASGNYAGSYAVTVSYN